MMKKNLILYFIIFANLPLSANEGRVEVAPFVGLRFGGNFKNAETDDLLNIEPSASQGLNASFKLPPINDYLEVHYSHQDSQVSGGGLTETIGVKIDEFLVGILREFGGTDEFRPFLVGLLGATHFQFSTNTGDETLFALGAGGGFKYFPRPNFGFRLDGRAYVSIITGSGNIACNGGCIASFSGSSFWQGEIAPSVVFKF